MNLTDTFEDKACEKFILKFLNTNIRNDKLYSFENGVYNVKDLSII